MAEPKNPNPPAREIKWNDLIRQVEPRAERLQLVYKFRTPKYERVIPPGRPKY